MSRDNKKMSAALKVAADLIEKSAAEIKDLRKQKEDLEMKNTKLKLSLAASERAKRAKDLAEKMFQKGMISKGNVTDKAKEIMEYDDNAFDVLREAVENAPSKKKEPDFKAEETSKEASSGFDWKEKQRRETIDKLKSI